MTDKLLTGILSENKSKRAQISFTLASLMLSKMNLNSLVTNGLSNHYHLDKSTFVLGASGVFFFMLISFLMKFLKANRIAPDGTPRFAASLLGLFCLPMSHKKDASLIWVNLISTSSVSIAY